MLKKSLTSPNAGKRTYTWRIRARLLANRTYPAPGVYPRVDRTIMRILLVEDDDLIGSGLEVALRNAGFTVDWARDGQHAEVALATTHYLLVILDLGLPKLSGMDLLKSLRLRGNDVPVLVLTARDTAADKVRGLDAGADDYLGKPFDLAELVSRCRALIRRSQGRSTDLIAWRGLTVDPVAQTVSKDGVRVALTARECRSRARASRKACMAGTRKSRAMRSKCMCRTCARSSAAT